MADFSGRVVSNDLRQAMNGLASIDKKWAQEWARRAKTMIAEPMAEDARRGAPRGRKGDAAGRSIVAGGGRVPVIIAGKGSWPGDHGHPWQPFFAMEFGMSRGRFTTYTRRRRRGGGVVVVRRRVRTWAIPANRGRDGLWLGPRMRVLAPEYRHEVMDLVDEFLAEVLP